MAPRARFLFGTFLFTVFAIVCGAIPAAAQDFSRILDGPALATGSSRSVNWVDADGDQDLDLYVTSGGSLFEANEYYRNDGGGVFWPDTTAAITLDSLRADGSAWGDYDNDGDPDLLIVSWYGEVNAIFENDGGGAFTRVTAGLPSTTGTFSEGCAWVDADNDGDLDIYIANSGSGAFRNNIYYRNDAGTYAAVTGSALMSDNSISRQGSWSDYDNDGDQDLYLANESNFPNHLYRNELVETGTANFSDIDGGDATAAFQQSWSASWGDYDNDGDFDLFVANWSGQKNALYRNELVESGSATLSFIADQAPSLNNGWGTGSNWFDWDNDGDVDLLMTNGFHNIPINTRKNWYYRNDDGVLNRNNTHPTADDVGWSYGASFGDYDADGDLDVAVANWQGTGQANYLYRNEADVLGNSWLTVKTVGTTSNGSGIGARIRVRAFISGNDVNQIREITGSDGYCGHQLRAHFGLGDATVVDSLIVNWPSGQTQVLTNVGVDQLLTVTEGVTTDVPLDMGRSVPSRLHFAVAPNPFASSAVIRYALERPSRVTLAIYDVAGREVRSLVSGVQSAGAYAHEWDGRDARGRDLPSGVYLTRIQMGDAIREGRKIVLAR